MTLDRAIEILDPEHRERYASIDPVNEACRMGMEALQKIRDGKLVEVVRCYECSFASPAIDELGDVTRWFCALSGDEIDEDGYCYRGEWDGKTGL